MLILAATCGSAADVKSVAPSHSLGAPSHARVPFAAVVNPLVAIKLTDGAIFHMTPLPLSGAHGAIVGPARFDASATRAVFLATFPGSAIGGDWRKINPTQAFLLDVSRRSLRQLTHDGLASSVRWISDGRVAIADGATQVTVSVGSASAAATTPAARVDAYSAASDGGDTDVTPQEIFRIAIFRRAENSYAVTQVGAQVLHIAGVSPDRAYLVIGTYLAWVDRDSRTAFLLSRSGPDPNEPPSFSGSAYGDALTAIAPLGHAVYQGAYRNGMAYFAFRFGVDRIVAATADLVNFSFPALPKDPAYTLGDGMGAGPDGALYFAGPENATLQVWRAGKYVTRLMQFPSGVSNLRDLTLAMERLDTLEPPMRPDQDALDAAMLQWRVYPIGDELGDIWVASYLGRVMVATAGSGAGLAHAGPTTKPIGFRYVSTPFPFAVLGRTDDGRLWGASPLARTVDGPLIATSASQLWSSRDGVHWRAEAQLDGDAGAVGTAHRVVWIALTREWLGRPMVAVARLDSARPQSAITGGSYAGEQLLFASLANGFFLIWGATPGLRGAAQEGALSAFRIDSARLFAFDGDGHSAYMRDRLNPAGDPSLPTAGEPIAGTGAILQPTLDEFARMPRAEHLTIASPFSIDARAVDPLRVTLMPAATERAYEAKYAERPYPLATVDGTPNSNVLVATRTTALGPLHAHGTRERWIKDASGAWRLRSTLSSWSY